MGYGKTSKTKTGTIIDKPVLSVPATSGQACRFNKSLLSSVQLSIFDTGFLHSPCPRLYVNVNGPTELIEDGRREI